MDILLLNDTEVQRLLDPDALLGQLAQGFRALWPDEKGGSYSRWIG